MATINVRGETFTSIYDSIRVRWCLPQGEKHARVMSETAIHVVSKDERNTRTMDPDEALKNARRAVKRYIDEQDPQRLALASADLVDAFAALDGWLSKGGFLPQAWAR
jgi:hypothetical protein